MAKARSDTNSGDRAIVEQNTLHLLARYPKQILSKAPGSTGPKTVNNLSVSVTSRKHISMQYVISMH